MMSTFSSINGVASVPPNSSRAIPSAVGTIVGVTGGTVSDTGSKETSSVENH